jgi:hypothetical protein
MIELYSTTTNVTMLFSGDGAGATVSFTPVALMGCGSGKRVDLLAYAVHTTIRVTKGGPDMSRFAGYSLLVSWMAAQAVRM